VGMIYDVKRGSTFICDEHELALLHCFGATWRRGRTMMGYGFLWVGGINIFPGLFGDHARIMVHCTNQFFIPVWWGVCTEAFLLGADLDAGS
jgi:hypothetical protein